ncbi:MAG: hypothetical protein V4581_05760 [Bacteroidota bacterium]
MKYVVIKGNNNLGRQTTIEEVCRHLLPKAIFSVSVQAGQFALTAVSPAEYAQNTTYVVQIANNKLVVLPGPATRQDVAALVKMLHELDMI